MLIILINLHKQFVDVLEYTHNKVIYVRAMLHFLKQLYMMILIQILVVIVLKAVFVIVQDAIHAQQIHIEL